MATAKQLQANEKLRAARQRLVSPSGSGRTMSRQELAEAVVIYLFDAHQIMTNLDESYIGKLERGEHRWPNALYRDAFRAVLGAEADHDLGFFVIRGTCEATAPAAVNMDPIVAGTSGLSEATQSITRSKADGRWFDHGDPATPLTIFGRVAAELGLLTPAVFDGGHGTAMIAELRRLLEIMTGEAGDGVSRSDVLRGILGLSALPMLSPLPSVGFRKPDVSRRVADPSAYATIAACHREMYWSSPARPLYQAASAHTQLGLSLVRQSAGNAKTAFAASLAESALLTARLAFFDLGQPTVAERCFDVALSATREAGDHSLAVAVLGHMSFVPIFGHQPEPARSLLDGARHHAWHGVHPAIRAWLHCTASEAEARAGDADASQHHIDLATAALDAANGADVEAPGWLDFFDASRLQSFAGYAALIGGNHAEAAVRLTSALDLLGTEAGKQHSVVLADLAACHPHDGDQQADYLNRALDIIEREWYGAGLDRVREVRPQLGDSPLGRELDARIDGLTIA